MKLIVFSGLPRKSYFLPWEETRLVVNAILLVDENLKTVLDWLGSKKEIPR
jgi:hypothetical protein